MTAHNVSASPGALRVSSKSSSTDSARAKRARTKHACDECRRSQKKCDGDKPLCRRCYLNGTHCTYTPHKSRNQCACTGQSEEAHTDAFVPDVFIFSDSSLSSFHTWSATSSPDQSPSASGSALGSPSPTNSSQGDRFGPIHDAVLELPRAAYDSEIATSPELLHRTRHINNQRSYSLPSFSVASSASSSPRMTELLSYPPSASFPHVFSEQIRTPSELEGSPSMYRSTSETGQDTCLTDLSPYHDVKFRPPRIALGAEPGTVFDISTQFNQQDPETYLSQRETSVLTSESSNSHLISQQAYDVQQYLGDQCSPYASDVSSTPLRMNYPSSLNDTTSDYASWLAHGYSNGVTTATSNARAVSDVPSTAQHTRYTEEANPNYAFLSQTVRTSDDFSHLLPMRTDAHDLANLPPSIVGRQNAGMLLLSLPSPRFSRMQCISEPVSPPLSGSYPSLEITNPSVYGGHEMYSWSH